MIAAANKRESCGEKSMVRILFPLTWKAGKTRIKRILDRFIHICIASSRGKAVVRFLLCMLREEMIM